MVAMGFQKGLEGSEKGFKHKFLGALINFYMIILPFQTLEDREKKGGEVI